MAHKNNMIKTVNLMNEITILVNPELVKSLMVVSHERSGTHLLMNALVSCTSYVPSPLLDFDLYPFSAMTNFYAAQSVCDFFNIHVPSICSQGYGLSSIIKSHHHADFFSQLLQDDLDNCKIV